MLAKTTDSFNSYFYDIKYTTATAYNHTVLSSSIESK